MEKITFCIPSKSNLQYLKHCIKSIRTNAYRLDHDIIIYVDEDTDGTVDWLEKNNAALNIKYKINPDCNLKLRGIGPAYNECILSAETDVVMIFHADMILGKDADYELYKHLTDSSVVCATRIEPPLHPAGPEKIIRNFGMWPEEFNHSEFNLTVAELKLTHRGRITYGCFAPWMVKKNTIVSIGLHDPILHSYHEDSDIFNRFILAGCSLIQSWESFVYHLTCRGGMFENGILTRSERVIQLQHRSILDYIRKWKSSIELENDPSANLIHYPKIYNRYHITLWDETGNRLEYMEPWVDIIYTTKSARENYIATHQPHTSFDLSKKIIEIVEGYDPMPDIQDILVYYNTEVESNYTQDLHLLLQAIRSNLLAPDSVFEYGNMTMAIKNLKNINTDFINCTSPEYISKLVQTNNLTGYIGGI